jgi:DNA-binding GntR family transcriptional regulator
MVRKISKHIHSGSQNGNPEIPGTDEMDKIRTMLLSKPRDLLLFDLLTQTGAKLKNTLSLKVKHILGLTAGSRLSFANDITNLSNENILTQSVIETLINYLEETQLDEEDYLFKSRKGSLPLSMSSASHLIRKWFQKAGIKGFAGARTLQKYWIANYKDRSAGIDRAEDDIIDPLQDSARILKPIESSTLQETVYQQLFDAIVSGRIRPGSRIVIGEIAKQMRVSPMPVREALHRLQATGFLSRSKKRANIVNKLSIDNLEEITNIRLVLEPLAAKYAAFNRRQETIVLLNKIHEDYVDAIKKRDSDRFLQKNRDFHHTIYHASMMPILCEIIEILWARVSPYTHILMRESVPTNVEWSIKTHADIMNALQDKNADKIAKILELDLSRAAKDMISMLNELWGVTGN